MQSFSHVFIKEILDNINPKLIAFAEDNRNIKFFDRKIEDILMEVISDNIETTADKQVLQALSKNKQHNLLVKKKRYLAKCENMRSDNEVIRHENRKCDKYFLKSTYNVMTSKLASEIIMAEKNFDEIEENRFNEIKAWSSNSESLMIDYVDLSEEKRTPLSIVNDWKLDAIISVLSFLKEKYSFDLSRTSFNVLSDFVNEPIFSPSRSNLPVEDSNPRKIVIYKDVEQKKKLIITLPEDCKDNKFKAFDNRDMELLSYLIARFENRPSVEDNDNNLCSISIYDVINYINKDQKIYKYIKEDILNRLNRLYEVGLQTFNEEKQMYTEGVRILSSYKYDENTAILTYGFDSSYLLSVNSLNIMRMSSKKIENLENPVAKILYASLELKRRKCYKKAKEEGKVLDMYIVQITYNSLLSNINFGDLNVNPKARKYYNQISEALNDYVDKKTLIFDWEFDKNKNLYTLYFYPLSEQEERDLNQQSLKENTDNIFLSILDDID